ncbi:TonB-dependent receptor [Hyphococcus luteus]|uniref:TonB-dependent receptor n=1 Tax=Hyphococcus luteus TaxID=2058213 RepID=A0A2S7K204_9PROT|nr:TonB-dependent receptor [Marinicaulis flavus]PQA86540.1 hypothetical protein CW354_19660 [Marinicaulis flavus]
MRGYINNRGGLSWTAALLSVSTLALAAGGANAQESQGGVDSIVVTATKREQNVNDVGAAVNAFSDEQLRDLGVESSTQIAQQSVGVYFAEGPLSHLPLSNIRGVSQNDFTGYLEPPNAIYIDQAYISFQGATAFQLYDIDRVEVIKGPQGTLFGRNATGGLIQYITKAPTRETEGYVKLSGGELGKFSSEGAVSGPISDSLSGRISGLYSRTSPYIDNRAGQDLMKFNDWSIRGQLLWEPTDAWSDRLILSYSDQDHNFAFQHSSTGFDPVSGLEYDLPMDENYYGNCEGCDPGGYVDTDGDPFKVAQDAPGLFDAQTFNTTNILTGDLSESVTLTSVSNYVSYEYSYQEDSDMTPRYGLLGQRTGDYNQFNQELRLQGDAGDFRWVGGLYFLWRDTDDTANQTFGVPWLDDVLASFGEIAPGDLLGLGNEDRLFSDFSMETTSYAAFGQFEYDFAPQWTLIGGLRYSYDSIDYSFVMDEFLDDVPAAGAFGTTNFTPATVGDLAENNKGEWSGQLALNYKPRDGVLLYLSGNRSNKAGGWNAPFTGGAVLPLDQEILTSIEGGFKALLADGKVQFNASGFHYFYKDYQGFTFVNLATLLTNLDADVTGGEVEIVAAPGEGWRLRFAAGYLDTMADTNVPTATGVRDSVLPLAPKWNLNGSIGKEWPAFGGTVSINANAVYTSEQYSEVLNAPAGRIPERIIGNVRVAYLTGDESLQFAVSVRNIGDDEKPIFRIPTHVGFTQNMYDQPTHVLAEITYGF